MSHENINLDVFPIPVLMLKLKKKTCIGPDYRFAEFF
jgi:hypothetical protein